MQDSQAQALQKASKDFLTFSSKLQLPTAGAIADFMSAFPAQKTKGLNGIMRALGEIIGEKEDIAKRKASEPLLKRLGELCEDRVLDDAGFEKEGYNPTDALLAVAFSGDEGPKHADIEKLKQVFQHNSRPIFDEIIRILTDIAVDGSLEIRDGASDEQKSKHPKKPIDEQGWRGSLKDPEKPVASDDEIKKEAEKFDKDRPSASQDDIKKSAADGGRKNFEVSDADRTEYERMENDGVSDYRYVKELQGGLKEVQVYYKLAKQLKETFDKTLGTCLYPASMSQSV